MKLGPQKCQHTYFLVIKFLIFPFKSHLLSLRFHLYAFHSHSYVSPYAYPYLSGLQEQEQQWFIGTLKETLLVQTSQERVLVIEVALKVKVFSVIGAPMPILLG